ncbi:hypothetical protein M422DRAFT_55246 [Sphaerobolus stellatus SS14]|uniref:Uncharacterized protein n=1 Tax=Sphaerobolus stellatus (strain SS14) TaxID=990650 RepID=A0A0C9UP04_SPHS4|nr:hypothetical protein M422DRAFT_55246 [Sphaerobolus stellatus SS14]
MEDTNALIASIEANDYSTFMRLLQEGVSVYAHDHINSKTDSFPVLPIHVAAKQSDPIFLKTLLEKGVEPNDEFQYENPSFSNAFVSAVRAGQWNNAKQLVEKGAVGGWVDVDYLWEDWTKVVLPRRNYETDEEEELWRQRMQFLFGLFCKSFESLPCVPSLPQVELSYRKEQPAFFGSLGEPGYQDDIQGPLSNLEWLITQPLLPEKERTNLTRKLLDHGTDVSAFCGEASQIWNARANAINGHTRDHAYLYTSPRGLAALGPSFHRIHSPLNLAVLMDNFNLIELLVQSTSIEIPEFSTRGSTPLLLAVGRSNLEVSKFLLEKGGALITFSTPIMQLNALHFAASTRDVEMISWVIETLEKELEAGLSMQPFCEQRTIFGQTPLHVACLPEWRWNDGQNAKGVFLSPRRDYSQLGKKFIHRPTIGESQSVFNILNTIGAGSWEDKDVFGMTPLDYLEISKGESTSM